MQNLHILHDFDQAITSLRAEVISMAGKARHNLERAIRALLQRNTELANAVIAADDEVDDSERRIDKLGMEMLVRFHPLASDLRLIVSSMKISMNLERISDHAINIAKRAKKISSSHDLADATIIEPIYTLADQLLRDSIASYSERDVVLGASLHARDKELDRIYKDTTAILASRMEQSKGRSQDYLHLIFVLRSLERVGDLAVNVGEDAVFLGTARDMRHESDRSVS